MIEFILNDKLIKSNASSSTVLLDFIRKNEKLFGTKIGCREGDCGACTVLVGTLVGNSTQYQSVASCLTPLGNIAGKHVVTVEGINNDKLSPIQKAFVDENATQCGFCTPGFVVSLTGFSLSDKKTNTDAISSVSGNICRCTGYKSIESAVSVIVKQIQNKDIENPLKWLIENNYLPSYFIDIPERLNKIAKFVNNTTTQNIIGGGTDLFVQKPDSIHETKLNFISNNKKEGNIQIANNKCIIKAHSSVTDLLESDVLRTILPNLADYLKLVSSEQIRNMGTVGGNIVNASPIGDLSIMFLALDCELLIFNKENKRLVKLSEFFKGYKQIDLNEDEIIDSIQFNIPVKGFKYNFEKVSKRTHLDIASANTAIYLVTDNNLIEDISISVGGLAPIPMLLKTTIEYLKGKELNIDNIKKAAIIMLSEVKPISDIRGSSEYKTLLLRQLFYQHFIKLFPNMFNLKKLIANA